MQSFTKFLLLAMVANAAAKCKICGEKNKITNPDGVLFSLGANGGCDFVAGSDPNIPATLCPVLTDIFEATGTGQVTCEDFEDQVEDINAFVCGLLPEQVDEVCACEVEAVNNPVVDPEVVGFIQLLIQFFQALFGF